MMRHSRSLFVVACVVCLAGILPLGGCPSPEGKSSVTVLLAGDAGLSPAKTRLDLESIQSLTVTVTQIALDYCPAAEGEGEGEVGEGEGEGEVGEGEGEGEVSEGEGEGEVSEGEGEGEVMAKAVEGEAEGEGECEECACNCEGASQRIVVFEGEKVVDLRDLSGISEVISSADVPAGSYSKIRLSIKDPQLVLADDPETVLTNVQLTANGRLFVSGCFDLPEGESSLVVLDFESFHLVQAGNSGKYVLTPQLRASIEVQDAAAQTTGSIVAVDTETSTLTLDVADSDTNVEVNFAAAAIVLADTTAGTPADLVVGANIQVTGSMTVSGAITADTITLLP